MKKIIMLCLLLSHVSFGATLMVTNLADNGAGSLRQAVLDAQDSDRIVFEVTGMIILTSGAIEITSDITVEGPGKETLMINGNGSSGIFQAKGLDQNVSISGLMFTNGYADNGGAVYIERASVVITNCAFHDCRADGQFMGGGAICTKLDAKLNIRDCIFDGNMAIATYGDGGAIYSQGNQYDGLVVNQSTFINNNATCNGGAVYIAGGEAVFSDCALLVNMAGNGGGLKTAGYYLKLDRCTVTGNTATNYGGGGLSCRNWSEINNSTINSNMSKGAGGGIEAYSTAYVRIEDCKVNYNHTQDNDGGGIEVRAPVIINGTDVIGNSCNNDGGGIHIFRGSGNISLEISSSDISRNRAVKEGGGIYAAREMNIANCLIADNVVSNYDGGGLYLGDGLIASGTVINTTISGNSCGRNGGAVYLKDTATATPLIFRMYNCTVTKNETGSSGSATIQNKNTTNVFCEIFSTIISGNMLLGGTNDLKGAFDVISHCLYGAANGAGIGIATNNIVSDDPGLGTLADNGGPAFSHAVQPGSLAIDSGINPLSLTLDQRGTGYERVFGDAVDIGAFEHGSGPLLGPIFLIK